MLSRQYEPSEKDEGEDEVVPMRRNRTSHYANPVPQLTINDLQKLEELAEEASTSHDSTKLRSVLRRSLSLNISPSGTSAPCEAYWRPVFPVTTAHTVHAVQSSRRWTTCPTWEKMRTRPSSSPALAKFSGEPRARRFASLGQETARTSSRRGSEEDLQGGLPQRQASHGHRATSPQATTATSHHAENAQTQTF